MRALILIPLILAADIAVVVAAPSDHPYRLREVKDVRDAAAINVNLIALSDAIRSFDSRDHIWTDDQDFEGRLSIPSKTLAELIAYTPTKLGEVTFCTDCNTPSVAISTGLGVGNQGILTLGVFE